MSVRASITFVIPVYKASTLVAAALASVFGPEATVPVDAVVVDDGSPDGDALAAQVSAWPAARLIRHDRNRGMCAARNTGILAATGDLVAILDADDRLVADWPQVLARVLARWPAGNPLCFTACRTQTGASTVAEPDYDGLLSAEDMVRGRHSGEYLPMMERGWIATHLYRDLGTRRSCGTLSYLAFARETPLWVCPEVMRIYTVGRPGSVTADTSRAAESARCAEAVLAEHGDFMRAVDAARWREQWLRLAYHRWRAGLPGAWDAWGRGLSIATIPKAVAMAGLFAAGHRVGDGLVAASRALGLLRRFG